MSKVILKTGQVLPNGAVVLKATHDKVLATHHGEFMYWTYHFNQVTGKIATYWGHYFGTQLWEAYQGFRDATASERIA